MEFYSKQNFSLIKTFMVVGKRMTYCFHGIHAISKNYSIHQMSIPLLYVWFSGLQLGYTVIFGSYASFLYIRTGKWFLTRWHLITNARARRIFKIKNKYSFCWLPRESKIVPYLVYYIFWCRAASWSIR